MAMSFTIVIPFGGCDPARKMALDIVTAHLMREHGWPIRIQQLVDCPWSKGRAVDDAVATTSSEGLIIHDADVLVPPEALRRAALAVTAGVPWAMPHGTVYRLSRRGMMRRLVVPYTVEPVSAVDLDRPAHPAPPGGGIVVLSRDAYERSGGIDPRFVGFGGDDISWARALDTLAGPGHRGDAAMWHLWHPPTPRRRGNRGSPENERLASRYLDAVCDPTAMQAVIAER